MTSKNEVGNHLRVVREEIFDPMKVVQEKLMYEYDNLTSEERDARWKLYWAMDRLTHPERYTPQEIARRQSEAARHRRRVDEEIRSARGEVGDHP